LGIAFGPGRRSFNAGFMRWFLIFCALWLGTQARLHSAESLYRREANQKSTNAGGRDFIISFEETRRDEKTSTAKVKLVSAGSVAGSMFIMRCWYDIAVARDAKYFIKLKESRAEDGSHMYVMGFCQDRNVDPKEYFGLREPLPKSEEYEFISVRRFAPFFKGKK
jgi:hypothetical protein